MAEGNRAIFTVQGKTSAKSVEPAVLRDIARNAEWACARANKSFVLTTERKRKGKLATTA